MEGTLKDIAQYLKKAKYKEKTEEKDLKAQLIYAFNGIGKTRLSREFKELVSSNNDKNEIEEWINTKKILYYNAFTEDLFYWDNDLEFDSEPKFIIRPNSFTDWIFNTQGKEGEVIDNFKYYNNTKIDPSFNENFSEVTFSFKVGNIEESENIKISKGEESSFIWCIFYSIIKELSESEESDFDNIEYIFIDDPVSSLDDNHLIQTAVDLAELIKDSKPQLKFIITTHNPLFYNVLHNALNKKKYKRYTLKRKEWEIYELKTQGDDSPFSYHLDLIKEIKKAIDDKNVKKYHFNFLRNILEKTATFLGYDQWQKILPDNEDKAFFSRIINISSHSKHSGDEMFCLTDKDINVLDNLINQIIKTYKFKY